MNYKIMYPLWNLDKFYFKWDKQTLRIGTEDTGSWNISDPEGIWEQMIGFVMVIAQPPKFTCQ